ncbi:hypothetical protein QFZ41_003245 [Luteibacter sp. W1I16]|uniref:hypothetical protein n=1 Tax=Luteibacter sp. W1I16 TaxID=3373922 RepID=UPI003D1D4D2C
MSFASRRSLPGPCQVTAHAVDEACKELGYALDILYAAEAEWNERMPRSAGDMRMSDLRHTCRYLEDVAPYRRVADAITLLWRVDRRLKAMRDADYVDVAEACSVLQRISDASEWSRPAVLFAARCHCLLPAWPASLTIRSLVSADT